MLTDFFGIAQNPTQVLWAVANALKNPFRQFVSIFVSYFPQTTHQRRAFVDQMGMSNSIVLTLALSDGC